MQAAGAGRFAIMRVCCYCHKIMGAKDEATKAEIPLGELGQCRMHVQSHNVVTSGVCPQCFKEQTGTEWPGDSV